MFGNHLYEIALTGYGYDAKVHQKTNFTMGQFFIDTSQSQLINYLSLAQ
jgi:hypothetical protein